MIWGQCPPQNLKTRGHIPHLPGGDAHAIEKPIAYGYCPSPHPSPPHTLFMLELTTADHPAGKSTSWSKLAFWKYLDRLTSCMFISCVLVNALLCSRPRASGMATNTLEPHSFLCLYTTTIISFSFPRTTHHHLHSTLTSSLNLTFN